MWSYLGSGLLVVISAAGLALRVITLAGSLCCGCEQVTLLSQGLPTQECKCVNRYKSIVRKITTFLLGGGGEEGNLVMD